MCTPFAGLDVGSCESAHNASATEAAPRGRLDHDRPRQPRRRELGAAQEIRAHCPELEATAGHVREFALMMHHLRGDRLEDWMARVQADELPALHSFVTGIKRDQDAVFNGLTLPWNGGAVEGTVTKVKLVKRIGYGRATLDLLRKRLLHTI